METSDFEKTLSMTKGECPEGAKAILEKVLTEHYTTKSVLGIDLYQYSKYSKNAQTIIPYLIHLIYDDTVYDLNRYETTFFYDYDQAKFRESFVDTGDGGFILFDTPFHALFFAVYFAFNVLRYNTKKLRSEIYDVIGPISLRYALTQDDIFQFDSNWYGPAITTCARILSRDRLNRFLIDESVKTWFDLHMNGIETMVCLGLNNLKGDPVYELIV